MLEFTLGDQKLDKNAYLSLLFNSFLDVLDSGKGRRVYRKWKKIKLYSQIT